MAIARQRTVIRGDDDLRRRRQHLYRAASPAFRALGFRQVTLKVLAGACGLSIPGLYRYFASKRDLALYPLSRENRPRSACFARASSDPLDHLRIWIEHGASERADFLLALSLMEQMDHADRPSPDELRDCFAFHESLLSAFIRAAAPSISPALATERAQSMLAASFGYDAIRLQRSIGAIRTEFVRIARGALLSAGVDAELFDRVMSSPPVRHECAAFCPAPT